MGALIFVIIVVIFSGCAYCAVIDCRYGRTPPDGWLLGPMGEVCKLND